MPSKTAWTTDDQLAWDEGISDLFDIMERKLLDGSMKFEQAERIVGVLGGFSEDDITPVGPHFQPDPEPNAGLLDRAAKGV